MTPRRRPGRRRLAAGLLAGVVLLVGCQDGGMQDDAGRGPSTGTGATPGADGADALIEARAAARAQIVAALDLLAADAVAVPAFVQGRYAACEGTLTEKTGYLYSADSTVAPPGDGSGASGEPLLDAAAGALVGGGWSVAPDPEAPDGQRIVRAERDGVEVRVRLYDTQPDRLRVGVSTECFAVAEERRAETTGTDTEEFASRDGLW